MADNLESATYETFENDAIKYDLYEEGMYKAFLDKKNLGRFKQTQGALGPQYANRETPKEENSMQIDSANDPIVVMYFGAGRGPLIRKALSAATRAKVYDRV